MLLIKAFWSTIVIQKIRKSVKTEKESTLSTKMGCIYQTLNGITHPPKEAH